MEILKEISPILGGVLIASLSYYFTKIKEREAEWRKEKLRLYIEFIESLTDNIEEVSTMEGRKRFAKASNNLYLFAPSKVLSGLKGLQDEINVKNPHRTLEKHNKYLSVLIFQIRKDIGIKENDETNFNMSLWSYRK